MRVGIIQSNYVPWRGYFDFISSSDLFIFHDDLQYTKGDWRNRNRIKSVSGPIWLTVPVRYNKTAQLICDTEIDYSTDWRRLHLNRLAENYRKAPFVDCAHDLLRSSLAPGDRTISELNIRLIRAICAFLEIGTPMHLSTEFTASGSKTEKVISLLRQVGAAIYLSGPAAKAYLDETRFAECGIGLEYKSYDYAPYPQLWGGFDGALSVLDLIANVGPSSREYLTSRSADITVDLTNVPTVTRSC